MTRNWNRMSQSPDPAQQGQEVTLCYDTAHATLPLTITVRFYPTGTTTHTVTSDPATWCWPEQVPANATGGLAVDGSGQSDDFTVQVAGHGRYRERMSRKQKPEDAITSPDTTQTPTAQMPGDATTEPAAAPEVTTPAEPATPSAPPEAPAAPAEPATPSAPPEAPAAPAEPVDPHVALVEPFVQAIGHRVLPADLAIVRGLAVGGIKLAIAAVEARPEGSMKEIAAWLDNLARVPHLRAEVLGIVQGTVGKLGEERLRFLR